MIRTDELRGIIAKNGLSQSDVAVKNWHYAKNIL